MPFIFANAGGGEGFVVGIFVLIVFAVLIFMSSLYGGTITHNVVLKNGAPYCPRCNRQVSRRRDYCRCCGYQFVVYTPAPPKPPSPTQPFIDPVLEDIGKHFQNILIEAPIFAVDVLLGIWFCIRYVLNLKWVVRLPDWLQPIVIGVVVAGSLLGAFFLVRYLKTM